MAEETKKTSPETPEVVVVTDVPVAEETTTAVAEKEAPPPQPEAKKVEEPTEESKITESASFKEESNKVDDLIDPEKKALDEFKLLIQEALNKHEFTAPPSPPPASVKEEEKQVEAEPKSDEKTETPAEAPVAEPVKEDAPEEKSTPTPETVVVEKVEEKAEAAEEIKETIVQEVSATVPPPEEPACEAEEKSAPAPPPEEVSIWGVPLLSDERSDVILLKFLRARDFKVKEAFTMLKNVVAWRKEFKIDELLQEEGIGEGLEKVVYVHGVDKEGHPVSYNDVGEFQDKELYNSTFSDAEKRGKFLRWYIQFLEKSIRKLDFSPEGVSTIVQVIDLKNSSGLIFKKELRQATSQALQLLQDNYPEFVARQVFINVPWWYYAYNMMMSPFLTQRTKSKFVFAGLANTTEILFRYIAPEQVPLQYGGLSRQGEQEFSTLDAATEGTIKPSSKYTIELPISEAGTLVWEVRVFGWDVHYGAEFVPSAEGAYTWIVQKPRKIGATDEQVLSCPFKIGEPGKLVLTFDNQTSKKKKIIYRSKKN